MRGDFYSQLLRWPSMGNSLRHSMPISMPISIRDHMERAIEWGRTGTKVEDDRDVLKDIYFKKVHLWWLKVASHLQGRWKLLESGCAIYIFASNSVNFWRIFKIPISVESLFQLPVFQNIGEQLPTLRTQFCRPWIQKLYIPALEPNRLSYGDSLSPLRWKPLVSEDDFVWLRLCWNCFFRLPYFPFLSGNKCVISLLGNFGTLL